jgi:hypothetical protein
MITYTGSAMVHAAQGGARSKRMRADFDHYYFTAYGALGNVRVRSQRFINALSAMPTHCLHPVSYIVRSRSR